MIFFTRASAYLALSLLLAGPAAAHRSTTNGPTSGLSIPSVTHGQMVVLADNAHAILALADMQFPTDPEMRRIQAFVALQRFTCGFGLVPGSIRDEDSPFNECMHATLAGLRSLLLHLQTMPGNRVIKLALGRKIDLEMLDRNASMVICQFSDEPFNTADVIVPRLGDLLTDPTSLAVFFGTALISLAGGAVASMARSRTATRHVAKWREAPTARGPGKVV